MRDADGYAPIADYGFLSDCRSAALVAHDGSVDWLCWPRFDSPSVFARVLDAERGGSFSIQPLAPFKVERQYVEGTNVLQTTFRTASGAVRVNDWLHSGARQALCRLVKCLEGEVELSVVCDPRPNYGRSPVSWTRRLGWLVAELDDNNRLVLEGMDEPSQTVLLRQGERFTVSLGYNRPGPSDLFEARKRAITFWRDWSEDLAVPFLMEEDVQEAVRRSALVLKGLQYEPSGAFVAAATTSLPESIGGSRNWDYRYSWLRDSTFTLYALRAVGKLEEASSWLDWLKMISLVSGATDLQIMYGIEGESELPEYELSHLSGYKNSQPVRVGNGAAKQQQLDVWGELADSIWLQRFKSRTPLHPHRWSLVKALAEHAAAEWRSPDEGIWEVRGGARHFVYSKVMCWVALDRAIRLARKDGFTDAPLEKWLREREEIRNEVLKEGYDEQLGAFSQSYGSGTLDASNLLLAQVGFIPAKDRRFVSTVRQTQAMLTRNGFVDRYRHDLTGDGIDEPEGTFTICTLWLVLALSQIGDHVEAEALYQRVLQRANDLGLFAEELSPEGEQLGNFPQAFTHIAVIACAFALDRARTNAVTHSPE